MVITVIIVFIVIIMEKKMETTVVIWGSCGKLWETGRKAVPLCQAKGRLADHLFGTDVHPS